MNQSLRTSKAFLLQLGVALLTALALCGCAAGVSRSVYPASRTMAIDQSSPFLKVHVKNGYVYTLSKWTTVSETNNYGFEIQRKAESEAEYKSIAGAFVPGHGTTLESHSYRYVDVSIPPGKVSYRLKQIDLDETTAYHGPVEVVNSASHSRVERAVLAQNWPNPFSPSTRIAFELPASAQVSLKIYKTLGQEVVTLVDEEKRAGRHEVAWNVTNMPSGVYLCRFEANGSSAVEKLLLLK